MKNGISEKIEVNSHNEWDPLEEVIIGSVSSARIPPFSKFIEAILIPELVPVFKKKSTEPYPFEIIKNATTELEEFINILKNENIIVKQAKCINFSNPYGSPDWQSTGFCSACPRDSILVIGNKLIEAPMSWRARYFERFAYRDILLDYFRNGAHWLSAPLPELNDETYNLNYDSENAEHPYYINNHEPLFDAADFMRFGKDILALRSHSANSYGIEWLRRTLGSDYTVHEITSKFKYPMHIDDHMMALEEGLLMINPEYIDETYLPKIFKSWEIFEAPYPDDLSGGNFLDYAGLSKMWINMNVLVLGGRKVVVEASQTKTIKALKIRGFDPIPCPFLNYANFGGLFHCCTVDIRRAGNLKTHFNN